MVKKKTKKQVIHLSEFLGGDAPAAAPTQPSWGDTPEEAYDAGPKVDLSSLPSAPRAQREGSFDPSKIPRQPPYTAYVGNLPFDTEDEDVIDMFQKGTVKDVRLLKEADTGRFKGYGYVEFETAEGLIGALSINEKVVRGRPIKVDVASQAGGGGGDNQKWGNVRDRDGKEREPYEDKTSDDWRRDRIVQSDEPPERGNYGRRDDRGGDRGFDRDDRRGGGEDTFSRSDFGSKMNDAPKEAYKPRFSGHDDRGPQEKSGGLEWGRSGDQGDREERRDDRRGGDRDRGGDRGGDRGAWERGGDRGGDRQSRDGGGERREGGAFRRSDAPREESPPRGPRTKLNLAARTKPMPDLPPVKKSEPESDRRGTPEGRENKAEVKPREPKANPFGAAKPADTNAWRSNRAEKQGSTGPIYTAPRDTYIAPKGPAVPANAIVSNQKTDELVIQDTNKFMLLDDEDASD